MEETMDQKPASSKRGARHIRWRNRDSICQIVRDLASWMGWLFVLFILVRITVDLYHGQALEDILLHLLRELIAALCGRR